MSLPCSAPALVSPAVFSIRFTNIISNSICRSGKIRVVRRSEWEEQNGGNATRGRAKTYKMDVLDYPALGPQPAHPPASTLDAGTSLASPPVPSLAPVPAPASAMSPKKLPAGLAVQNEPSEDQIKSFSPEKSHARANEERFTLFGDVFLPVLSDNVAVPAPPASEERFTLFGDSFLPVVANNVTDLAAPANEERFTLFGDGFLPIVADNVAVPVAPAFRQYELFPAPTPPVLPTGPIAPAAFGQYPFMVTPTPEQKLEYETFRRLMTRKGHYRNQQDVPVMVILAATFGLLPTPFFLHDVGPDGSRSFGVRPFNFLVDSPPVPIPNGNHLDNSYIFKVLSKLGEAIASKDKYEILYQVRECMNYINYGTFESMFKLPFPPLAEALTNLTAHALTLYDVEWIFYGNGTEVSPAMKEDARVIANLLIVQR
jgi:hypothetical protein